MVASGVNETRMLGIFAIWVFKSSMQYLIRPEHHVLTSLPPLDSFLYYHRQVCTVDRVCLLEVSKHQASELQYKRQAI